MFATHVFIKSSFKTFDLSAIDYLRWEGVPCISYSIKKKEVFWLFRSEAFANDFKTIVSGAFFPVNNKITANIDVVKALEHFENLCHISAQSSIFQAE